MQPQHAKRWIAKSLHNLREYMMSDSECVTNEITGPKDGPGDDASRYGDGTLRLALDLMLKEAAYNARMEQMFRMDDELSRTADAYHNYATLYSAAAASIRCAIKEKACSAGDTTSTSTPSP